MSRGPVVTAKLAGLVASMRAGGVRLGIGDLITAHRALNAVDPADREESRLALRTALCKRHGDLEVFDAAFVALDQRLADANDWTQCRFMRSAHFPVYDFVGLAK